jgi:hypothetical protein
MKPLLAAILFLSLSCSAQTISIKVVQNGWMQLTVTNCSAGKGYVIQESHNHTLVNPEWVQVHQWTAGTNAETWVDEDVVGPVGWYRVVEQ